MIDEKNKHNWSSAIPIDVIELCLHSDSLWGLSLQIGGN